ncbi:MAG TPA: DMT family transporter [Porticoccus sp.]|nr:DMT family transporter [Porticoccus sp.]
MKYLPLLAIFAGVAISLQATLNARLGVLLQNTLLGTGIAFMVGCLLCLTLVAVTGKLNIKATSVQTVPVYLWFTGGALGALGVGLLYFLIPKMGIGPMTVFSLVGQLLVATAASHFGWLDLPQNPVTVQKLIGFFALFTGVVLVNGDKIYAH